MDFSGATMIVCLSFWFASLSSAMNISARLFLETGGDLMSKYCSPRFCQARSCMGRMPRALPRVELPSWAYLPETEGID
jgi:hypothetical protein